MTAAKTRGQEIAALRTQAERPDLRVELKVKNNVLWHVIYDTYDSVSAFCRAFPEHALHQTAIADLLRFKASPMTKQGTYRKLALTLERIFRIPAEDLFPRHLYENVTEPERVIEVSSFTALPRMVQREIRLLPAPAEERPDQKAMERERREKIEQMLRTLTYREREVLRLRFGLMDGTERTLEEIGEILKVSRERVRQIERKAIRKMQDPYRNSLLEDVRPE